MPATKRFTALRRRLRIEIDVICKHILISLAPMDRRRRYVDKLNVNLLQMFVNDIRTRKRKLARLGGEK